MAIVDVAFRLCPRKMSYKTLRKMQILVTKIHKKHHFSCEDTVGDATEERSGCDLYPSRNPNPLENYQYKSQRSG